MKKPKCIWIDLENSPHVLFFRPIIKELEDRGYRLLITARDAYNVYDLLDRFEVRAHRIGRHYGKHLFMKAIGLAIRAIRLSFLVLWHRPVLAVSHVSRAQLVISSLLRIPSLAISDYEHAGGKGFSFIKVTTMMCPEAIFNAKSIRPSETYRSYPGIKEDVYIPDFKPDHSIYEEIGLSPEDLIVTVRPPATTAHYFVEASGDVFLESMEFLLKNEEVKIVLLPRTKDQANLCRQKWKDAFDTGRIIIPNRAVDGINLCWHSDLVVSGGGTMNREAATLGRACLQHLPGQDRRRGPIPFRSGAIDPNPSR